MFTYLLTKCSPSLHLGDLLSPVKSLEGDLSLLRQSAKCKIWRPREKKMNQNHRWIGWVGDQNPDYISRDFAKFANCLKNTVTKLLTGLGYKNKWSNWPPQPWMTKAATCKTVSWPLLQLLIYCPNNNWQCDLGLVEVHAFMQRPWVNRYGPKPFLCLSWNPSRVFELLDKGRTGTSDVFYH